MTTMSLQEFWDAKAQSYPDVSDEATYQSVTKIIETAQNWGYHFDQASVLEIGAGTGNITIPMALRGAYVNAVDLSPKMLEKLIEKSQYHQLTSIQTRCSSWEDLMINEHYDYVVSTFCPAIATKNDILRLSSYAIKGVLLALWGDKRVNPLWDEIYTLHGLSYGPIAQRGVLPRILQELGISYKTTLIETSWEKYLTPDEAVQQASLSLQARQITPKKEDIENIIDRHTNAEGKVRHHTTAQDRLLSWQPIRVVKL